MSNEAATPAPLPRYRGLYGALAYGLLIAGFIIGVGLIAAGAVWFLTKAVVPSVALAARVTLVGAVVGAGAALCRWLCGAATDRLLSLRFDKGDFGAVGLLFGLGLTGFLSEPALSGDDDQTPAVAGPTLDGARFNLAEQRGKVVLVDFWATWCQPCVAELPHIRAIYDRYHANGLEIVGVNLDSNRADVVRFLKATPLPWPQIFFDEQGSRGFDNPISKRFAIDSIPRLFLFDREGQLIARNLRGDQIEHAVAEALGEPVPWYERWKAAGSRLLNWLFVGIMTSAEWLLVVVSLGGALAGALVEWSVRRLWQRPGPSPIAGHASGPQPQLNRRKLIIGMVGVGFLLVATHALAAWLTERQANPAQVWTFRLECTALPRDDRLLTDWLKAQAGVTQSSVKRDGDVLTVIVETAPKADAVDVVKQALSFGYAFRSMSASVERKP